MLLKKIVFAGPTLSGEPKLKGIEYRPPAKCGDVARAVVEGYDVIAIVDGFFETTRSVWHKEILWALSLGRVVAGASSIGALRAAEMHPFGMIGVGKIFKLFASGELTDDDEVAVEHAPAELDYLPITDPMVNIRFTLEKAVQCGVLDASVALSLTGLAKSRFFKERSFDRMISDGIASDISIQKINKFMAWLPLHAVDIKRADAKQLLRLLIKTQLRPAKSVSFIGSRYWTWLAAEMHPDRKHY